MRSRLEARWATFLDKLQWRWEYEPDLQVGRVIPDFVLPDFAHPIVLECKPTMTIEENIAERIGFIARMSKWLTVDVLREIAWLDRDPEADLALTDQALDDLVRVERNENPRGRSRRVLIGGAYLFIDGERVTIDGEHGFTVCCAGGEADHIGLGTEVGKPCLLCGENITAWAPSGTIMLAWRESTVQWSPR